VTREQGALRAARESGSCFGPSIGASPYQPSRWARSRRDTFAAQVPKCPRASGSAGFWRELPTDFASEVSLLGVTALRSSGQLQGVRV
jgi:hypothetical protein